MSVQNNLTNRIESINISDTLSQFMEKCNNNFSAIMKYGGGPNGEKGNRGSQGVPTRPKVPIHVWTKGVEYEDENNNVLSGVLIQSELKDSKYQDGHLIILENAHVYILETDSNFNLKPTFVTTLFNPVEIVDKTIDGRTTHIHIAYSDNSDGDGFTVIQNKDNTNIINKPFLGICCTFNVNAPSTKDEYQWFRIQSNAYNIILSNPSVTIPSSISDNQEFSTYIAIYNNGVNVTKYSYIRAVLPANETIKTHFNITKEVNRFKLTFNPKNFSKFDEYGIYTLPISILDTLNNFTTSVNWYLNQVQFYNVELFVNKKIVNISDNLSQSFEVGYYLNYPNGDRRFVNTKSDNINGYKIALTNNISRLDNKFIGDNDWSNATYDFGDYEKCYVVLTDSKENILDYINITTITSEVHLELSKDHISIPCKLGGGGVHSDYINDYGSISLEMALYSGKKNIDSKYNISYKLKYNDKDLIEEDDYTYDIINNKCHLSINPNIIVENTTIQCVGIIYIYNNKVEFVKDLHIELIETPHKFILHKNNLTRNSDGIIVDNYLDVEVKYYMSGKWKRHSFKRYPIEESCDCVIAAHTLKEQNSNEYNTFIFEDVENDEYIQRIVISEDNFKNDEISEEIRISYYTDSIDKTENELHPNDESFCDFVHIINENN